jgi:hypothetical protein
MTRTSSSSWRYRAIAFLCIVLGCASLGPIVHKQVRSQVAQILQKNAIDMTWQAMSWNWNGACIHSVRLQKNSQGFQGYIPRICATVALQWSWPPLAIQHVYMHQPELELNIAKFHYKGSDLSTKISKNDYHQKEQVLAQIHQKINRGFELIQQRQHALNTIELKWSKALFSIYLNSTRILDLRGKGYINASYAQGEIKNTFFTSYKTPLWQWSLQDQLLKVEQKKSSHDIKNISKVSSQKISVIDFQELSLTPQRISLKNLKLYWPKLFSLHADVQVNFIEDKIRVQHGHVAFSSSSESDESSGKRKQAYSGKVTPNSSAKKQSFDLHSLNNRMNQRLQKLMKPWQSNYRPKVNALQDYLYQFRSKFLNIWRKYQSIQKRKGYLKESHTWERSSTLSHRNPFDVLTVKALKLTKVSSQDLIRWHIQSHHTHKSETTLIRNINFDKVKDLYHITLNLNQNKSAIILKINKELKPTHLSWHTIDLKAWQNDLVQWIPGWKQHTLIGKIHGELTLPAGQINPTIYGVNLTLTDAYLQSTLFKSAVGPLKVHLKTTLYPGVSQYEFKPIELQWQNLTFTGESKFKRKKNRTKINLKLSTQEQSCQEAFLSIPASLRTAIQEIQLSGHFKPKLKLSFSWDRKAGPVVDFTLKKFLHQCHIRTLKFKLDREPHVQIKGHRIRIQDVLWLKEPFIFTVDPALTKGAKIRVGPGTRNYTPLKELPAYVGAAMYLTEEMGFWRGASLSPTLIKRAINTNLKGGKFIYGGSTIIQQLVKNLFLSREKSIKRKIQEIIIAAATLDQLSKNRILELYLNCIEFAPKVFGITAAAQYYFQKDARALNVQEAIFLAMLKVAPWRGPSWIRRGHSPTFTWWKQRSVEVLNRLLKKGQITSRQAKDKAPFILRWKQSKYLGAKLLQDDDSKVLKD